MDQQQDYEVLSDEEFYFLGFPPTSINELKSRCPRGQKREISSDSGIASYLDFRDYNNESITLADNTDYVDSLEDQMRKIHEDDSMDGSNTVESCEVQLKSLNKEQCNALIKEHLKNRYDPEYTLQLESGRIVLDNFQTIYLNRSSEFYKTSEWQPKIVIKKFSSIEEMIACANYRKKQRNRIKLFISGETIKPVKLKYLETSPYIINKKPKSVVKRVVSATLPTPKVQYAKYPEHFKNAGLSTNFEAPNRDPSYNSFGFLRDKDVIKLTEKLVIFGGKNYDQLKLSGRILARYTSPTGQKKYLVRWFMYGSKDSIFGDELVDYDIKNIPILEKMIHFPQLNHEQKCYVYRIMMKN